MNGRKKTYFNEIPARESRHILLTCIKAFNLMTIVFVVLGFTALMGHQGYAWALQTPFFHIKEIDVQGNRIIADEEIVRLAGVDSVCNIFRLCVEDVQERIVRQVFIRNVEVKRRLPSKVILSIVERNPVVCVEHGVGMLDDEGVLLPPLPREHWSHLPLLVGVEIENEEFGKPLQSESIQWAISFLQDVAAVEQGVPFEITTIDVSDPHHPLLFTDGGHTPILIGRTGSLSQLMSLPIVLNDLERKGIEADVIDVRFSDQIVVRPRRDSNMGLGSKAVKG